MKMLRSMLLGSLVLVSSVVGCEEDPKLNPNKLILGKWEVVEDYFGPIEDPSWYEEYLPDSICVVHNSQDGTFYTEKYWFADSLLVRSFLIVDPAKNDTIEFNTPYRYQFLPFNKLRLEFEYPAFNPVAIYRRIN